LMPSVLGESSGLLIVIRLMVTLSQASGLIVHIGELRNVRPSTSTLREFTKRKSSGRRTSMPLLARWSCHHISPRASMVPRPVSETLSRSSPAISGARRGGTLGPSHLLDHMGKSSLFWLPRSVAPASRCRVMLLFSQSVPVTYLPAGTSTVPPPPR